MRRIDVEGPAIISLRPPSPGMDAEELSWHVDDVIKRQAAGDERRRACRALWRRRSRNSRACSIPIAACARHHGGRREHAGSLDERRSRRRVAVRSAIRSRRSARLPARGAWRSCRDQENRFGGGREVRLNDLGRVIDDASEQRSFGRLNKPTGRLVHRLRPRGRASCPSSDVSNEARSSSREQPIPTSADKVDDAAVAYTRGNYISAIETLIEGAVLAVLVVLLFLRNCARRYSAVALPLSAIPTFWAMSLLGFSLNLVSLLGITLATGILVDDAIVEIENIVRHMRSGEIALSRRARGRDGSVLPYRHCD